MKTFTEKLSPTITNIIRMEHSHVLTTFHQYEINESPKKKQALVNSACLDLEIHGQLEEEIFYPAVRTVMQSSILEKSVLEHEAMRESIADLRAMEATHVNYDQTFMKLMQDVLHHVADEETVLLPGAERLLEENLYELGAQMAKRRLQLAAPRAGEIALNSIRGFPIRSMLVAAGALLAGTYLVKRSRSLSRHA
jgi:hemerythrin superfamily protein